MVKILKPRTAAYANLRIDLMESPVCGLEGTPRHESARGPELNGRTTRSADLQRSHTAGSKHQVRRIRRSAGLELETLSKISGAASNEKNRSVELAESGDRGNGERRPMLS